MQKTISALSGPALSGPALSGFVFGALILVSGCGDGGQTAGDQIAPQIRTVESGNENAACDAGEELLSAYCYVKPNGGVSASGVVFQETANGSIQATCLTGGRNIRLFCLKR